MCKFNEWSIGLLHLSVRKLSVCHTIERRSSSQDELVTQFVFPYFLCVSGTSMR